jgi:hypothetical protein
MDILMSCQSFNRGLAFFRAWEAEGDVVASRDWNACSSANNPW